jgi:hypothetical protein
MQLLWSRFKTYSFIVLWLVNLVWMYQSYLSDPPIRVVRANSDILTYGRNLEGEFQGNVVLSLIEIAILHLIIRPWSFNQSVGRVLLALVLLLPWAVLLVFVNLHAGQISKIHLVWLFLVSVVLIVILVVDFLIKVFSNNSDK